MVPQLRLITDPAPAFASTPEFVDAMSELASGVVIVTCRLEGRPWGTTVTAFASVSADPPAVLVSLASASTSARAIAATRRFGVSILGEEQVALARYSSAPGGSKFLEPLTDPGDGPSASPAIAGANAHLDCELFEEIPVLDHTVFLGRVRAARGSHAGAPLVHYRRSYRTLAADRLSTERSTPCLTN
jgi:flavin reductase (DIM6/NTAB) family NADH-FMN oxidoreductase RutF